MLKILFVSHDESFVQTVATRVVRFEQGKLITRESPSEQPEEREVPSADRQIAITTLDDAEFRRAYGTCLPAGEEDHIRMTLYRLLYGLMDGYVYACEYRMPEESRQCQQKMLQILSQLE